MYIERQLPRKWLPKILALHPKFIRPSLPIPVFLAFKEMWRYRGRYLLISLVIALITTLVLFIAGLAEGLGAGNKEYLDKLRGCHWRDRRHPAPGCRSTDCQPQRHQSGGAGFGPAAVTAGLFLPVLAGAKGRPHPGRGVGCG